MTLGAHIQSSISSGRCRAQRDGSMNLVRDAHRVIGTLEAVKFPR